MERAGIAGTKIWKEELKKLVVILAGATAIYALVQAWRTGYSTGIRFSFDRFNGPGTGNYTSNPPPAAISLQSRYGGVEHEYHSINNLSLRGTDALAPAGSFEIEKKNQSMIGSASTNDSLDAHDLKLNDSVTNGANSTILTTVRAGLE